MNKGKKRNLKTKHPGIFLLLRTLKRVIKKDDEYVQKILLYGDDADNDYIEIRHNGNIDYGKTIYVIKENSEQNGFCATILFIIWYLIFAEQHGFAPKILLSDKFLYFDEEKSKEISNPWEYYFDATGNYYDESKALNVCYNMNDKVFVKPSGNNT